MRYPSALKLLLFSAALFANVNYVLFILNPAHIGNVPFYLVTLLADGIVISLMTYTWFSSLHAELLYPSYLKELEELQTKGKLLRNAPTAILVPVVREPLEIVRVTLKAAKKIKGNIQVFLLDDGQRAITKALAKELEVKYITREDRAFNKAGNLNNAIQQLPNKYKYIAVFDADFIAEPQFLQETLPIFIDKTVGAVQTPQEYYNSENLFARGSQSLQTFFYKYLMPSKHMVDSAFCVGTNVVYRRSSLDLSGGIFKIEHSEDIYTTLSLLAKGYKTFYVAKSLAKGLAPDNLIAFFNQQFRWAKGGFSLYLHQNPLFNKTLSWDQKIQFFFSAMYYLSGFAVFLYMLNPLVSVLLNIQPINSTYYQEWVIAYALLLSLNSAFYMSLGGRHKFETFALSLFSFIPYLQAFWSVLLSREFTWKTTNARFNELVTRIVAPFITYLFVCGLVVYLFATGVLIFKPSTIWYLFWIIVDAAVILYFVLNSYRSIFINPK
jgi:cellulose synthase (UDP-forming)